jgi:hypothetical protein
MYFKLWNSSHVLAVIIVTSAKQVYKTTLSNHFLASNTAHDGHDKEEHDKGHGDEHARGQHYDP